MTNSFRELNVLVGCEFSGVVREAFRKLGHNAWSCDLLPSEDNSEFHIQHDLKELIYNHEMLGPHFDLMIFHPPCTHLAVSGARWFKDKQQEQQEALEFVRFLLDTNCNHIALENPVSIISSHIRKPDQYIQPWQLLLKVENLSYGKHPLGLIVGNYVLEHTKGLLMQWQNNGASIY